MANYYAVARTNYVLIKDVDGLKKALEPFSVSVEAKFPGADPENYICILSRDGGWPSLGYDNNGDEVEFDFIKQVCPFMEDGQVLITMEAGHGKLRYVTGYAWAYHSDGRQVGLSLDDIYTKAAVEFGVPRNTISKASY